MRKIQLDRDDLAKILNSRVPIHKKIGELNEKLAELDKERKKESYKMERLKEKTKVIIDELSSTFNLSEFEIITNVGLNNSKYPEVTIVDQIEEFTAPRTDKEIEEYKEMIRERNKKNESLK